MVPPKSCKPPHDPCMTLFLYTHTGCFDNTVVSPDITHGQLFGWEVVMTFTLISVVYACGVAKPGHGSFTPLAVGLSLVACAGTGKNCNLGCAAQFYKMATARMPSLLSCSTSLVASFQLALPSLGGPPESVAFTCSMSCMLKTVFDAHATRLLSY